MNANDIASYEAFLRDNPVGAPPAGIDDTLADRRKTHGRYSDHARITQALKKAMWENDGWARLTDGQAEALEMVAHKIGRILAGDPNFPDHWHDIEGYARLGGGGGE